MTLRIGSLCSGYGGLDLAVEAVFDARTAWFCEHDRDPSAILAHHWPHVPNHGDVKTTDWSQVEPVDILTAGYPCPPFSIAGKRKGADDPRHLWPDVATAISVLRPRLAVLENVAGHLTLGFADVLGDLATLGYDARWGVVRASDAGAPHRRERIFVVASDTRSRSLPRPPAADDRLPVAAERRHGADADPDRHGHGTGQDAGGVGPVDGEDAGGARERERARQVARDRGAAPVEWGAYDAAIARWAAVLGRPAPGPVDDGRLNPRFAEWLMGLPEGHVTDVPGLSAPAQLKAIGNGVVPQQAALALRLLLADMAAAA